MAIVEVLEARILESAVEHLAGCSIDAPRAGHAADEYFLSVGGWVVGRHQPVTRVGLVHEGEGIRRVPLLIPRDDVLRARLAPDAPLHCGFWTAVGTLGLAPTAELTLRAAFQDESKISWGVIRLRHERLDAGPAGGIRPLLVTSLGRTGTTWLLRLLSAHDRIVSAGAHPYEIRSASYWAHLLKVMTEPADHLDSAHPDAFHLQLATAGHHPWYVEPTIADPPMRAFFGRSYPEASARFARESIERFYRQTARASQTDPLYFAEKSWGRLPTRVLREIHPDSREIFLIRDLRDVLCSILAFNAKRNEVTFGRERVQTDVEFVAELAADAGRLLRTWEQRRAESLLLRYEDLVRQPADALGRVLAYLDLEPDQATIARMVQTASEDTPDLALHRTSATVDASVERWRDELSPDLKEACRSALAEVLEAFGYPDTG